MMSGGSENRVASRAHEFKGFERGCRPRGRGRPESRRPADSAWPACVPACPPASSSLPPLSYVSLGWSVVLPNGLLGQISKIRRLYKPPCFRRRPTSTCAPGCTTKWLSTQASNSNCPLPSASPALAKVQPQRVRLNFVPTDQKEHCPQQRC